MKWSIKARYISPEVHCFTTFFRDFFGIVWLGGPSKDKVRAISSCVGEIESNGIQSIEKPLGHDSVSSTSQDEARRRGNVNEFISAALFFFGT